MWTRTKPWLFVPGVLAIVGAGVRYTLVPTWDTGTNVLLGSGFLLVCMAMAMNWKSARQFYKKRSTVYFTFTLVSVLVMLGILSLVNFIVWLHPRRYDLTANQFFTLSEHTQRLLDHLDREVRIVGFYRETERDGQLEYLLRQYQSQNHRIKFQFVDPDRDPALTQDYGVSRYGTIMMESEGKRLRVDEPTEGGLSNTLLKLIQVEAKSVYFLTGHGERNFDSHERDGHSRAKQALEESNYHVKLLNLLEEDGVPEDCEVLIISGVRVEPTPGEMEKIEDYLNQAGSLLLLLDPKPFIGFEAFMRRYGVAVGDDVVIDASGAGRTIGAGPDVPLIQNYAQTEITFPFSLKTFYPRARSVMPTYESIPGVNVVPLMATSRSSWGETELGPDGGGTRFDEGKDLPGPVSLAVKITKELGPAQAVGSETEGLAMARLVVFGDSDFANNVYFTAQGNGDLFLNSVNWLAGETDLIAIRPKKPENRRLDVTAQTNTAVFYMCMVLLPAVPLTGGVWVLFKRVK